MKKIWCLILLFFAVQIGAQQKLETYSIVPSDTDGEINSFNKPHAAYFDAGVKSRNKLVVFLPGTFGSGQGGKLFSQTAAELGFHVVSLSYPTDVPASVCRNEADEDCFEKFRLEVITGEDKSALIEVNRANSIENRLQKLLLFLSKNYPKDGWEKYLNSKNEIEWKDLILTGQSQGGGHAPLMAKYHKVSRVVMFSAPKDYSIRYNRPAKWYGAGATPAKDFYAFVHQQDRQGCTYPQQLEIFGALEIDKFGELADVDKTPALFNNSRVLVTNYPGTPVTSGEAHTSTMGDARTPRTASGELLFKPVWTYMLTAN